MTSSGTAPAARCYAVGAIAFDLDGTLLDTIHDLAAAVNTMLAEMGYPPLAKADITLMVGKGLQNLVRRALARAFGVSPATLEDAEVDAALARYYVHYTAQLGRETELYPGVLEGLQRIAALGIPMAVITNKARRFALPHLDLAGLTSYFRVLVGGDDLPRKKPAPDPLLFVADRLGVAPAQLLMVGDSINDAQAARAAGCPVLILPYGYNEGEPVHAIDADDIVPSLLAVADRVRRIEPQPTAATPS